MQNLKIVGALLTILAFVMDSSHSTASANTARRELPSAIFFENGDAKALPTTVKVFDSKSDFLEFCPGEEYDEDWDDIYVTKVGPDGQGNMVYNLVVKHVRIKSRDAGDKYQSRRYTQQKCTKQILIPRSILPKDIDAVPETIEEERPDPGDPTRKIVTVFLKFEDPNASLESIAIAKAQPVKQGMKLDNSKAYFEVVRKDRSGKNEININVSAIYGWNIQENQGIVTKGTIVGETTRIFASDRTSEDKEYGSLYLFPLPDSRGYEIRAVYPYKTVHNLIDEGTIDSDRDSVEAVCAYIDEDGVKELREKKSTIPTHYSANGCNIGVRYYIKRSELEKEIIQDALGKFPDSSLSAQDLYDHVGPLFPQDPEQPAIDVSVLLPKKPLENTLSN